MNISFYILCFLQPPGRSAGTTPPAGLTASRASSAPQTAPFVSVTWWSGSDSPSAESKFCKIIIRTVHFSVFVPCLYKYDSIGGIDHEDYQIKYDFRNPQIPPRPFYELISKTCIQVYQLLFVLVMRLHFPDSRI